MRLVRYLQVISAANDRTNSKKIPNIVMGIYRAAAIIPTDSVLSRIVTSICWRFCILIRLARRPVTFRNMIECMPTLIQYQKCYRPTCPLRSTLPKHERKFSCVQVARHHTCRQPPRYIEKQECAMGCPPSDETAAVWLGMSPRMPCPSC